MDHRNMYKARGQVGRNIVEASRARATQRATNRNNLHSEQRNISPVDEELNQAEIPDPVPKMKRVDRLQQWRAERELRKQQEAAIKKKPFISVVKKGVFLDTTNYTEINKKFRKKSEAKKVKKPVLNMTGQVASSESQSLSSESTHSSIQVNVIGPLDYPRVGTFDELNTAGGGASVGSAGIVPTLKLEKTHTVNDDTAASSNSEVENSFENTDAAVGAAEESVLNSTFEVDTPKVKVEKSDSVNDDTAAGEASSSETLQKTDDMNQSHKTPVRLSLNSSLNYVSPFVTVARGKRSAQREERVRESLYKLETSQPVHLSPSTRQNREAAAYFRSQVNNETERLTQTTDIWNEYKIANSQIDSVYLDQVDVAIGQTKLLITKKFNQFLNLINQCEDGSGEKPVRPEDLEGFWSMVYMQVENCDERFRKLENLKKDNWIESGLTPVKIEKRKKKRVNKKGQGVSASSGIQKMIEAAREKLKEDQKAAASSSTSNSVGSNYSMALRQTPARRSSIIPRTPKSIIKTPGVRRITKNVVFSGLNSPSEIQSLNLHFSAIEIPKAPLTPKAPTPKAATLKAPTPKAPTPKVAAPKVATPKALTLPNFDFSDIEMAKAPLTPKAPTPKVAAPKVATPKALTLPNFDFSDIEMAKAPLTPKAPTPSARKSKAPTPATRTPSATSNNRRATMSGTSIQRQFNVTQSNSSFSTPLQSIANDQSTSSVRRSRRLQVFSVQ